LGIKFRGKIQGIISSQGVISHRLIKPSHSPNNRPIKVQGGSEARIGRARMMGYDRCLNCGGAKERVGGIVSERFTEVMSV
jgi:hypothetical protein